MRYVKHFKKLDSEQITNDKIEQMCNAIWNYKITKMILPILLTFTGKKITKNIVNKINKETELNCKYSSNYGMYHIIIYKENNSKYSLLIGYDTNPIIGDKKQIEEYAMCYLLESERAEKIKCGLKHIKSFTEKFNKCIDEIKKINKEAEQYEMEYDFDLCSKYLQP